MGACRWAHMNAAKKKLPGRGVVKGRPRANTAQFTTTHTPGRIQLDSTPILVLKPRNSSLGGGKGRTYTTQDARTCGNYVLDFDIELAFCHGVVSARRFYHVHVDSNVLFCSFMHLDSEKKQRTQPWLACLRRDAKLWPCMICRLDHFRAYISS